MLILGAVALHSLEAAWNDWFWPALGLCVLGWLILIVTQWPATRPRHWRELAGAAARRCRAGIPSLRIRWTRWRARRARQRPVAGIARQREVPRAQAAAGRAVDAAGKTTERELLDGVRNLPHAILDDIEP